MIRRTLDACEAMKRSYEIILVDDGSVDKSASMIEEASLKYPHKIIGVILTTNFGQHAAVTAGLAQSRGKYVVTLDADLQNPPEEIHKLVENWRKAMMSSAQSAKTGRTPSSANLRPRQST